MDLVSTALIALGAVHLAAGIPTLLAPGIVRARLPQRYAEAVGDRRAWRGFGAGVLSIGISLLIIGYGLAP
jgi:dipeptide/tripeptide permease